MANVMKPTTEILARISTQSRNNKEGVFTRLYRYMLRTDIYYQASQILPKGYYTREQHKKEKEPRAIFGESAEKGLTFLV